RPLFYRFAASTVVLSYAAVVTFLLYPAAPPWAAGKIGLLDVVEIGGPEGATSTGVIHGNPYAAIPSLHAGYAFMVFLMSASLTTTTSAHVPGARRPASTPRSPAGMLVTHGTASSSGMSSATRRRRPSASVRALPARRPSARRATPSATTTSMPPIV